MSTFINLETTIKVNSKSNQRHLLYSMYWLLLFVVVFLRLDSTIFFELYQNYPTFNYWVPFSIILIGLASFFIQKWYYSIALVFYPILSLFWFIPKFILLKGKFYVLMNYANSLLSFFSKFKQNLILLLLATITFVMLIVSNSIFFKYFGLLIFSIYYFRYFYNFITKSLSSPKIFGQHLDKLLEGIMNPKKNKDKKDEKETNTDSESNNEEKNKFALLNSLTIVSDTKNELTEIEIRQKKIGRIYLFNIILEKLVKQSESYRNKRAFTLAMLFEVFLFFIITIIFFFFVNVQLFSISDLNFQVGENVGYFDFFYYTFKNIALSSYSEIIPLSIEAKITEMLSFFLIAIFILVFVISVVFSLKQDKIDETVRAVKTLCEFQYQNIDEFSKMEFGKNLELLLEEVKSMSGSILKTKDLIDKYL